ncbi:hypothetical protein HZH68_015242 [Vespula germanica]|uniref:Ig-like domain-containing protein n=1 Tax=Vespula germanica TaxID=30212 RepID=A0A834MTG0_VESGE|nr:hypothetical protein HZH68_015242 [Vespula germanica]
MRSNWVKYPWQGDRKKRKEISFSIELIIFTVCHGIQQFEETPQYTEVNPGQDAKLICRVLGKRGQCIWQKDQKFVFLESGHYAVTDDKQSFRSNSEEREGEKERE